jgi:hypothetical protein
MGFVEANALLRIGQEGTKRVDLFAERLLSLAGGFEFLGYGVLVVRIEIGRLDGPLQGIQVLAVQATAQGLRETGVDHLGQTA